VRFRPGSLLHLPELLQPLQLLAWWQPLPRQAATHACGAPTLQKEKELDAALQQAWQELQAARSMSPCPSVSGALVQGRAAQCGAAQGRLVQGRCGAGRSCAGQSRLWQAIAVVQKHSAEQQ